MMEEMKVGDVWCSEEPLAYVLSSSQLGKRCDNCLSPSTKLLKCLACGISRYCNTTCQESSWKHGHRAECDSFKKVSPQVPSETTRLLYRILVLRQMGLLDEKQCTVFGKSRTFKDLVSNTAKMMLIPERLDEFKKVHHSIKALSCDDGTIPAPTELEEIYGKICANNFSIFDAERKNIGVGIYLRCSALDHSCQANAVAVFTDTTLTIRCTEQVSDESKLRISYTNVLDPTSERRRHLEEHYYIICQCDLCLDTELDAMKFSMSCPTIECNGFILQNTEQEYTCATCSTVVKWEKYSDQYSSAISEAEGMVETVDNQQGSADDIFKKCTECLARVSKFLHPLNIYFIQLQDRLMKVCQNQNRWSDALIYAQANIPSFRKYYPKHDPFLGMHLIIVGNLQSKLDLLGDAMASYQQALDILQVTHGKDHELCQNLFFRLREATVLHAALSD